MPRGRPRKNPLPETESKPTSKAIENSKNIETQVEVESGATPDSTSKKKTSAKTSSKISNKDDKYPRCECCGDIIYSSSRKINLVYLLSAAPYRFNVKNTQLDLCSKCGGELSQVVDEWLISHGAEKKFEVNH